MRSSLRKLRGLGIQRCEAREKREHRPRAKLDELVQAVQDMQDMKSCYDGLLSTAAATANSAFEFSEALREMGTCLLEKTALHDDEDSGRVLLMLGKAQFDLQKLVDTYRTHIIQTITTPSECLLGELQIVEEMKQQCDDKREFYKLMLTAPRVKGKSRNTKGEAVTHQQLQAAREDYEEDTNLFIFRLKSLKQGQSRSLLTQAARHHAAQLNFFRKGLKSLELIEPHVKAITEQNHIDYHFRGLEDDHTDFDDDGGSFISDSSEDGELCFDYGLNEHAYSSLATNSMELDQVDSIPAKTSLEYLQEMVSKKPAELLFCNEKPNLSSQSAPIFANMKFDISDRTKETPPQSTRKYHTYALPTPVEVRNSLKISFSSGLAKTNTFDQKPKSPMDPHKAFSGPAILPQVHTSTVPDPKQLKWQAFSGPIIGKSRATSIILKAEDSPVLWALHELPRPPTSVVQLPGIGHSAPLVSRGPEVQTGKAFPAASQTASPLPVPPPFIPRSFSIPYRGERTPSGTVNKPLELHRNFNLIGEVDSPPLTPLSLKNFGAVSSLKGPV